MDYQKFFLLIGLSGGPDSVVLLHRLCHLTGGRNILATHCNFHLRGEESMRDQHFCEELCRTLDIPLLIRDFDTRGYMAEHHVSLELAAREQRYQWWEELASDKEAETGLPVRIAVGHHRDDSIETLLMNLMRGTGIKGMTGIPVENGRIIRPLSEMSRTDIIQYLEQHHLTYVTDSTNLENEATRNQIRNLLLPVMEQINQNAREGIAKTMLHLQQTEALAQAQLDSLFATTQHLVAAGVEWHEWRIPETITDEAMIATLFHSWSERYPNARQHRRLFYTEIEESHILSSTHINLADSETLRISATDNHSNYNIFDKESLQLPLTVRHWQQGDRIQPLGMSGTKLVSDLFTDAHYTPNQKATSWILADASGRILWVVGLRMADWCKTTPDTRHAIKIEISDEN